MRAAPALSYGGTGPAGRRGPTRPYAVFPSDYGKLPTSALLRDADSPAARAEAGAGGW
ncbi:hypothetical protein [Streptomyces lydicus]|uniref:hypothetical protein n=1 Tax=Streptomyces lydicus TaxID=47763 RepID=UPI0037BBDDF8